MGHAEKVHRDHYRLPTAARQIGRISQLLEMGVRQRKDNIPMSKSLINMPKTGVSSRDSCDESTMETSNDRQGCDDIQITESSMSKMTNIDVSRDCWDKNAMVTSYGR